MLLYYHRSIFVDEFSLCIEIFSDLMAMVVGYHSLDMFFFSLCSRHQCHFQSMSSSFSMDSGIVLNCHSSGNGQVGAVANTEAP